MSFRRIACATLTGALLALPFSSGESAGQDVNPKLKVNSLGMKLASLPPGEFDMGTNETPDALSRAFEVPSTFVGKGESPQHHVIITEPYLLGVHEVTIGQFRRFVQDTDYKSDAERSGKGGIHNLNQAPEYTWRNPGFAQTDEHPVTQVTWNDAIAFCKWLSKKEGQEYRLPTEAEWEYACRAGKQARFGFGDDLSRLSAYANVRDASYAREYPDDARQSSKADDGFVHTAPVGKFKPNAFGLYDMHGNVGEWCSDWFDEVAYAEDPQTDPTGPISGRVRVQRGGSFGAVSIHARSAARGPAAPFAAIDVVGFRVACSARGE